MLKLTYNEKKFKELLDKGMSTAEIGKILGIKTTSVYAKKYALQRKLAKMEAEKPTPLKTIVVKKKEAEKKNEKGNILDFFRKKEPEVELKRCRTFSEFKDMMNKVKVDKDYISLEARVDLFKDTYCKVCIYPDRCDECPTKILMDKYL